MLPRIALISFHASPLAAAGTSNAGGLNVYIKELSSALSHLDIPVDIFTRQVDATTPEVVEIAPGVRVISIECGPAEPLPPDSLLPFVPLFTAGIIAYAGLHDQPYNLIHSHYWLSGLAALRLRRRWQIPTVHMFHTLAQVKRRVSGTWTTADERRAELEEEVLRDVDAVVAANSLESEELRTLYDAGKASIHAIPCGVNRSLFRPRDREESRRALGLSGEGRILFAAARIEPLKNLGTAIKALAALREHGIDDARLLIAGGPVTGPAGVAELQFLQELCRRIHVEDRVHFIGALPQEEVPIYMSAADAVVVPSLYESFGMIALEALACGRPVVASAAGGLQLTVHDGQNGYLVPPYDAGLFAARLASLLAYPVLAQRVSREARRSTEPYGWATIAERTACLYTALLQDEERIALNG